MSRCAGLLVAISVGLLCLLPACVSPAGTTTPPAPTKIDVTPAESAPSATDDHTQPTLIASPSGTTLPGFVFSFASRPWPEAGNLLANDVDNTEFALDMSSLQSGDYLLLADEVTKAAMAYSINSGEIQTLFVPDLAESGPEQVVNGSGSLLFGSRERAGTWRLYDLNTQESWGLGPNCRGPGGDWISPDAAWIGTVCGDFLQLEGVGFEHFLVEFISPRTGTGTQFVVPSTGSPNNHPYLTWNDDGRALLSQVWIEGEHRVCSISPEEGGLFCPPLGLRDAVANPTVDVGSPWIAFGGSSTSPNQKLVPRSCFAVGAVCNGIIEVTSEIPISLLPTSDPGIVWWIERRGPDPTSEFGLFDPDTGEMTQTASLGGTYFAPANCPDGSCLILFNPDTELNWRLSLDGTLEVLPFKGDVVAGAFQIP